MVAEGADTIYDPEHWVVASYIDPRGLIGAVSNAGRVLIKTGGQIGDVATADALEQQNPMRPAETGGAGHNYGARSRMAFFAISHSTCMTCGPSTPRRCTPSRTIA